MHLCYPEVVGVVFWVVLVYVVDEGVYFYADSEDVEVWYVEDVYMNGLVCVWGGRFIMILMSFFVF